MKKTTIKLIYGLLLLSHFFVYSQNKFNSYEIKEENLKTIFRFEDETNKKNILVLNNKETTNFILFDENYNERAQINNENLKISGEFIGFSIQNSSYFTYWQKNKTTFEVLTVDFNNKNVLEFSPILNLEKREKVISVFNKDNKFYLVTHPKNSDILNIFEINGTNVDKKIIDFSKIRLIDFNSKTTTLSNFIDDQSETVYRNIFSVIDQNSIIANTIKATEKKKIFIGDDKLVLCSDINLNYSQYLFIDLNNSSVKQLSFAKGSGSTSESNSFLINDKIFILKFGHENASLTVKDLNNNSLKSINISGTLGHEYINSDLVDEFGSYTKREILENKSRFFKRIDGKNPSLSGYYSNNKYYLTIAGVSYPQQNSMQLGMFGAVGAIIGEIISYNSSNNSIQSFSDKNILYFTCILDGDKLSNSNEKYLNTTSFDNLRSYIENNKSKEVFLEPFQNQNKLILIGFDKKEKKLNFYRF